MKKFLFLVGVMVLVAVTATVTHAKPKPKNELTIIFVKKQVVYFKVDKSFIGGSVEIYDKDNNCLEADSLPHTHTMVHFDEVPTGHYIVKVKKGSRYTEFEYINI